MNRILPSTPLLAYKAMEIFLVTLVIYRIRINIGGYNIWRFIEIMDLARYQFGEIIQK